MHILIGLHAGLGEAGALMFLWVLVELLNPAENRIKRAKIAATLGVIFLIMSWLVGGYYYLGHYQSDVKSLIKGGPTPWAHLVMTESKEHIFMFLPFLGLVAWGSLMRYGKEMAHNRKGLVQAVIILSGLIVLMSFAIAGMGYLISSGVRSALEQKLL